MTAMTDLDRLTADSVVPALPDLLQCLAHQLTVEADITSVLQAVIDVAVSRIAGADQAGVVLLRRRSVSSSIGTAELVCTLDRQQDRLGAGPSLAAAVDPS